MKDAEVKLFVDSLPNRRFVSLPSKKSVRDMMCMFVNVKRATTATWSIYVCNKKWETKTKAAAGGSDAKITDTSGDNEEQKYGSDVVQHITLTQSETNFVWITKDAWQEKSQVRRVDCNGK